MTATMPAMRANDVSDESDVSDVLNPSDEGMKFAVTVPAPFTIAVVEFEVAEATVMGPVALHDENV
jgi:hypothetical protein